MPAASSSTLCGLSWCGYPQFLQKYATTKAFIVVYGVLGTFQAMGYIYFVVTLQTIEKRFKIPSQTTGLILSGNEISQILLSVILAYFGGQRNRPRFIAWGGIFFSLSCFVLALPHFLYGAGEEALRLTKEYVGSHNETILDNSAADFLFRKSNRLCMSEDMRKECNDEFESIVPLVLIFMSQFVLGIGNTLYYALGQTYVDDNTKKTNTPLLMSYAFALRTFGPAVGTVLGYTSLKMYIDPTKTPLIDSSDPRWMGAWWFGWVFLGIALAILSLFIGMFPKELPKKKKEITRQISDNVPRALKSGQDIFSEEQRPLNSNQTNNLGSTTEIPTLREFPAAMVRLFKNKILMCNIGSMIFYILGAAAYFTFMSKYMEVQFHKSAADAIIITGPFMILGVCIGLLASGYIISKLKPAPSKLLFWNVIVGFMYLAGQISNLYLTCPDGDQHMIVNGKINLTSSCNTGCNCDAFSYTPVCWEETGDTFFNPCVASCHNYSKELKVYHQCDCARDSPTTSSFFTALPPTITPPMSLSSSSSSSFSQTKITEMLTSPTQPVTSPPPETSPSTTTTSTTKTTQTETTQPTTKSSPANIKEVETLPPQKQRVAAEESTQPPPPPTTLKEAATEEAETPEEQDEDEYDYDENEDSYDTETIDAKSDKTRKRRAAEDKEDLWGKLSPGACMKGCAAGFYAFTLVSSIINCFGSSGRIGNLLVNYRCVSKQDKSVTQGLILMLISLFALIPGPIMFGHIIDSTCLVWTEQCSGRRGNCQLYDQKKFRYYINLTAFALTSVGVFFDGLVWKFGKNLDLYGEREEEMLKKQERGRPQRS